jgi:hypothetical protein
VTIDITANKRQTRPLLRQSTPHGQDQDSLTVTNIWSWVPDGAWHQDGLTDWLTDRQLQCDSGSDWPLRHFDGQTRGAQGSRLLRKSVSLNLSPGLLEGIRGKLWMPRSKRLDIQRLTTGQCSESKLILTLCGRTKIQNQPELQTLRICRWCCSLFTQQT